MIPTQWRVVAALFTVTACVACSVSAFGVFLPVLSETFGWSRGAISVALSINLVWGGVAAFAVGGIADRHGPRGVLAATVLIGALGFALTSRITALWHLYLSYGLLVGLGMSSIYVLTTATVSRWFQHRRGLALAVVLSGFNLGWLVGGPASLCVHYPTSPRMVPLDRSRAVVGESLRAALEDRRLWYLVASWFLLGLVYMMVSVHSVPYVKDRGLTLEQAALALTAFGIGAAIGRLAAGAAADRLGTGLIMRWCLLVQGVALVVLVMGPPTWAVIPALVAFGIGASGSDNTFVKVVPEVFGLSALASIMSVIGLGFRCGAGLGPAAAGFLHDATRSYTLPFGIGLIALAGGFAFFGLGAGTRRHRR
jgi:MFS family permease